MNVYKYIGDESRLSECVHNGETDNICHDEWCESGKCCGKIDGECRFYGLPGEITIMDGYKDLFEVIEE